MKRVLIVDDEPHVTRLVALRLRKEGYEAFTAAHGVEALALFESDGPFDVVVTDYNMPKMDGRELCETIRHRYAGQQIYIFLVTARLEEPLRSWAGDLPRVDYIEKPISLRDLVGRLEKLFGEPVEADEGPESEPGDA